MTVCWQLGRWIVTGLHVIPESEGWKKRVIALAEGAHQHTVVAGGLKYRDLRRIPWRAPEIVGEEFCRSRAQAERLGRMVSSDAERSPRTLPKKLDSGDLRLAQLAWAYETALKRGSRAPLVDVADKYEIKRTEVRDGVRRAKEKGFFTTPDGRVLDRDARSAGREDVLHSHRERDVEKPGAGVMGGTLTERGKAILFEKDYANVGLDFVIKLLEKQPTPVQRAREARTAAGVRQRRQGWTVRARTRASRSTRRSSPSGK